MGFGYRITTVQGKQTLEKLKQNLVHTRTQEKGTVTPKESEPDSPESDQESLADMGLTVTCHRVKGTEYHSPGSPGMLTEVLLKDVITAITTTIQGGTQPPPSAENWIKDLGSMAHPIRARPSLPQQVPPIRKLPQASNPSPSESRQMKTIITEN